jgi:hypothetical protein
MQLAAGRALVWTQALCEGILVSLPTSQQCQQPTVRLALDEIHHRPLQNT